MIIRDAFKEEILFIRKQRVLAYEEHASLISENHWLELKQAISSQSDVQPGVDLIVAVINEKIVGSVALFPAKIDAYEGFVEKLDYPEIRMLAVSSEARGKGVAAALVKECIHRARRRGYSEIGLHTADFMKGALKLYEKLGFKRLPEYDFEPADDGIIVKAFKLSL
ncbi:GNAT family N-acetyltransferase [Evansella cellulosilytica]|uniref:GCN5-related N-acetyltransferase n=1 Tax=Evansella cellulosilytica (strain ATCC 21833 / DSM 2522 / FERM P-1141 / JCM 9156 / N-4) TaxID=649639 RepID=E6TZB6_EVAC2|nr:GNAT family N-acetyltransferase [Evansella cellulosilytica]ADU28978.1 GCN5-related N-acetyltransferase [Evansella cellulosilytica DSM 2522]